VIWLTALALAQDAEAPDPDTQAPPASEVEVDSNVEYDLAGNFVVFGEARWLFSALPQAPLDADGTTSGQTRILDQRVRAGVAANLSNTLLVVEADVLTGQLLGPAWTLGEEDRRHRGDPGVARLHSFAPRRATLARQLDDRVFVQGGILTPHFGLGMASNDGSVEPLFGRVDGGDTVLRAELALQPRDRWNLRVAVDRIYADDAATWVPDDQAAWRLVLLSESWSDAREWTARVAMREQRETDLQRRTTVGEGGLYGRVQRPVGAWTLGAAGELQGVAGRSGRTPTPSTDQHTVLAGGALLQVSAERGPVVVRVRGGVASGDADPTDRVDTLYRMDPNANAGMLLFDEVHGAIDARAHQLAGTAWGQPPLGAETWVGEGALAGQGFAQPSVDLTLGAWGLRAGATVGWSVAPVAHPVYSALAGGSPRTHTDTAGGGHYLGTELAGGVTWTSKRERVVPSVSAQGALLLPGEQLPVGRVGLGQVTARVRW
jgi:hypothetical protein